MTRKGPKRFKVLTNTICDGWVDCWMDGDEPCRFETRGDAEDEIQDLLKDMPDYSREDYKIVEA